jgi:purine-nucleoside phosphorylase
MDKAGATNPMKDLDRSAKFLRRKFGSPPDFAVVFGSGLGSDFLKLHRKATRVPYGEIPAWPCPKVDGHQGEALRIEGKFSSALALRGRVHYYEGYSPDEVVIPVRSLALWGVKRLLLTNASGSIRKSLKTGSLVLLKDHLNLTGANPLRGPNLDFLGPRFPSLDKTYLNSFSKKVEKAARSLSLKLLKGVYVGIAGPSYETAAEIEAFRRLGGDLVGMSTVFEAIAATHAKMEVAALAAVTNSCLQQDEPPSHEEVLSQARQVDKALTGLLQAMLGERISGR